MQIEVWKDVIGYEGLYRISNTGKLFSIKRNVFFNLSTDGWGYCIVVLRKDKSPKSFRFHRLVASHFISNDNNLPEVNHKDGDKKNNSVNNLEWCTPSHNMLHAFQIGLKSHKGDKAPGAKITNKKAEDIRKMYGSGLYKQKELASLFAISQSAISAITLSKRYSE